MIPELHQVWEDSALRILPPSPVVVGLFQTYEDTLLRILEDLPSDPTQPNGHIKVFRFETHDFVKAVIDAVSPPEPE